MRIFTKQKIIKIEFTRIIIVSVVLFLLIVPTASAVDCGLRVYNGTKILKIDCESAGTLTSPLRIRKGETTYGIVLVPTSDANALPIRINTSSEVKALKKIYPWTIKATMPTARNGLAAVAVNNIIYAIGGWNGSSVLSANQAYDPSTNTWSTKASMPTARDGLATVAVNNIIYAIGGTNTAQTVVYSTNEAYNPSTNTWSTKTAMPTGRSYLVAAAVNNIIYAIGGGATGPVYLTTNQAYDPE